MTSFQIPTSITLGKITFCTEIYSITLYCHNAYFICVKGSLTSVSNFQSILFNFNDLCPKLVWQFLAVFRFQNCAIFTVFAGVRCSKLVVL